VPGAVAVPVALVVCRRLAVILGVLAGVDMTNATLWSTDRAAY